MRHRLSQIVIDMYDRVYSWLMFTTFVTVVVCLVLYEVIYGRRK
jgi:hypothetical protein